jgi:hypothetical protein
LLFFQKHGEFFQALFLFQGHTHWSRAEHAAQRKETPKKTVKRMAGERATGKMTLTVTPAR